MLNDKYKYFRSLLTWLFFVSTFSILLTSLSGCGGGGSASRAATVTQPTHYSHIPGWYPPSIDQIVRTTAEFGNVTYYLPTPSSWYLFNATAKSNWISAVGTTAGLSASMTNPFNEVGVVFLPKSMYANPGQVTFYIDGVEVGSLDMSADTPYEGYNKEYTSYYQIASKLPETVHTVTMVIATGTIAFDGWRMFYKNQQYNIDCSDVNTLEEDTLTETYKIRDAVESYADEYGSYPNPGTSDLITFLESHNITFADEPANPYTLGGMEDKSTYSAGDYHYIYNATSSYSLSSYGGRGTLVAMTESSVKTTLLELDLTTPSNFYATSAASVPFRGTTVNNGDDDWGEPYLAICCWLNGQTYFPATGTFNVDIKLKEGKNSINVALADPYGNTVLIKRTITKDTSAPNITIIDPFPLRTDSGTGVQYYLSRTTPITIKATVEAGSTATLNGIDMEVNSQGVISGTMDLVVGDNTFTITAADSFGNTNTVTYTVVYAPLTKHAKK